MMVTSRIVRWRWGARPYHCAPPIQIASASAAPDPQIAASLRNTPVSRIHVNPPRMLPARPPRNPQREPLPPASMAEKIIALPGRGARLVAASARDELRGYAGPHLDPDALVEQQLAAQRIAAAPPASVEPANRLHVGRPPEHGDALRHAEPGDRECLRLGDGERQ